MNRTAKVTSFMFAFALGIAACWAWVATLGLFTEHVWFPLFKQHWSALGGGDPSASFKVASTFSSLVSAAISVVLTLVFHRLPSLGSTSTWLTFASAFMLILVGPLLFEPIEGAIRLILLSPNTLSFLAASAIVHWILLQRARHAVRPEP